MNWGVCVSLGDIVVIGLRWFNVVIWKLNCDMLKSKLELDLIKNK